MEVAAENAFAGVKTHNPCYAKLLVSTSTTTPPPTNPSLHLRFFFYIS